MIHSSKIEIGSLFIDHFGLNPDYTFYAIFTLAIIYRMHIQDRKIQILKNRRVFSMNTYRHKSVKESDFFISRFKLLWKERKTFDEKFTIQDERARFSKQEAIMQ